MQIFFKNIFQSLKFVWQSSHWWTIALFVLLTIQSALPILNLFIHWSIGVFLFLLIFPSLYITARYSRKLYQWQMKRTELERKGYYLKTILTSSSFAKEVRLFHVGDRIDLCSNLKTSASIYRKKNRIF